MGGGASKKKLFEPFRRLSSHNSQTEERSSKSRNSASFLDRLKERTSPKSEATAKSVSTNKANPPAKTQASPRPSPAPSPTPVDLPPKGHVLDSSGSHAVEQPEYIGSQKPLNEVARAQTLCSLNILDTVGIFKVPICLVSLVDNDRQWFKSKQGLAASETDRKSSFCAWTLLPNHPEVLVVDNALEDIRFRNNPLVVGFPHIRFYAGCPLVATNSHRLGSLCIIDNKPRTFDTEACNMLANFAEMVVREIEKENMLKQQQQKTAMLSQENKQLLRAIDCFSEGIMLLNMSLPRWPILFVNEAWESVAGIAKDTMADRNFWDILHLPEGDFSASQATYTSAIEKRMSFDMKAFYNTPDGSRKWLDIQFRCASNENVDQYMPLIGIPSTLSMTPHNDGPSYYFAVVSSPPADLARSSTSSLVKLNNQKLDPFDDVKLGPLLGTGAYGRVYRGLWNGAHVAVKVLQHTQRDDGSDTLEALLSGQITHPNVVQTYKHCMREVSSANEDGKCMVETWIIMEFCNKGSLMDAVDRGWFREKHSLFESDWGAILTSAREIASAMCYLHGRNILHGDLTSNNILLGSSEKDGRKFTTKVADFGLARIMDAGREAVSTRTYGTVTHMPPELLLDGILTLAADVYAFGVVCWEMVMGQRPYSGLSHGQIIHHVTSNRSLQMSTSIPSPMRKFIQQCMSPKQSERPTFAQILTMLKDLEEELC